MIVAVLLSDEILSLQYFFISKMFPSNNVEPVGVGNSHSLTGL
jgi:hypothetical protein